MDPSSSLLSSLRNEARPSREPEHHSVSAVSHDIEEEPMCDPEDDGDLSEESSSHSSIIYSERSHFHTPSDILVDDTSDLPTVFSRGWTHFIKHGLTPLTDLGPITELVDRFPLEVHRTALPELLNQTKFLLELYDIRCGWLCETLQHPIRAMALKTFPAEEMRERLGVSENLSGFETYLEWVDTLGNRMELEQSIDEEALMGRTREVLEFLDKLFKKTRELETIAKLVACAEIGTCDWLWEQNEYDPRESRRTVADDENEAEGNGNAMTMDEGESLIS